ncbi:MAG: sigma 54-interacting transcriptional regulator [Gemmatimonadetes bacterium]|nr:sigma 54-interacting transcriptional regulator [Gemmatimonadota bacterium]
MTEPIDPCAVSDALGPTTSPALLRALETARRVARHPATTVVIEGETGTGKEVLARAIHAAGPGADEPFVALNCGAIPAGLLESELFGHERGAFSGAERAKPGLLEEAGAGTLFLDEIAELPVALQAKLLRVLQDRRARRLGGLEEYAVSCRFVAATNRPLRAEVEAGRFREDLFFRLDVVRIGLPPLRERPEDLLPLADRILTQLCAAFGVPPRRLSPAAEAALHAYTWPGNVRELRHALERAVVIAEGDVLEPHHLALGDRARRAEPASLNAVAHIPIPPEGLTLAEAERQLIATTLRLAGHNQSRAARMLGVSRPTVIRKIRALRLHEPPGASGD